MPCDRYEMDRVYTNIAFDPPSAHYVGTTAITVPFQAYDEEGEIQLGPEGGCTPHLELIVRRESNSRY